MPSPGLSAAATPRQWGLPRGLIVLLGGAATVIIVAGVQGVAWLIGPAFMALIVVIAVSPAQGWLRRKDWPTWATTLVVVLLVYAILIGFALGIILSIAQLGTQLPLYAATPAVLALLAGGPQLMVIVIIVYCAINFVVQSIIQPRFIGDAVGLSVTVTFLALVFWAWLIGPLGAILAIPLTLLAKAVLVDVDPHAGWADAFLRASATKPEPPAAEVTAEAERSPADTELAAAAVPTPHVEEPGPPSRESTTHVT